MLADDEVELVFISQLSFTPLSACKDVSGSGKHVLCEKAFTVNAEQAQNYLTLQEKKLLIQKQSGQDICRQKLINDIESGWP